MSQFPSFFCNKKNKRESSEDSKVLEFNQYQKPDNTSFVIYADLECLIEKTDGCKNNPENSSTTEISEHIPSGFSMSTISSSKIIKISMMYIEVKIAWKIFVSPWKST